jgi:hypothetical protein
MSFNIFSTGSLITDVEKVILEDDMVDIEGWVRNALDAKIDSLKTTFVTTYKDRVFEDASIDSIPANIDGFVAVVTGSSWYKNASERHTTGSLG